MREKSMPRWLNTFNNGGQKKLFNGEFLKKCVSLRDNEKVSEKVSDPGLRVMTTPYMIVSQIFLVRMSL
jgi:hypothetical protein